MIGREFNLTDDTCNSWIAINVYFFIFYKSRRRCKSSGFRSNIASVSQKLVFDFYNSSKFHLPINATLLMASNYGDEIQYIDTTSIIFIKFTVIFACNLGNMLYVHIHVI
jgi:hypothetical protein